MKQTIIELYEAFVKSDPREGELDWLNNPLSVEAKNVWEFLANVNYGTASEAIIYSLLKTPNTKSFNFFLNLNESRGKAILKFYKEIKRSPILTTRGTTLINALNPTSYLSLKANVYLFHASFISHRLGTHEISPEHLAIACLLDSTAGLEFARRGFNTFPFITLKNSGINPKSYWDWLTVEKNQDIIDPAIENHYNLFITYDKDKLKVFSNENINPVSLNLGETQIENVRLNLLSNHNIIKKIIIEEFEDMINTKNVKEYDLQLFFERNPSFLNLGKYSYAYPQIILSNNDGTNGNYKPDFVLQHSNSNYHDIYDIKLPQHKTAKGQSRRRTYSSVMWDSIAQLKDYKSYFNEQENRAFVENKYGLKVFMPKIGIIIGRDNNFANIEEKIKLKSETPGIEILTYDDILNLAKHNKLII